MTHTVMALHSHFTWMGLGPRQRPEKDLKKLLYLEAWESHQV